jgi:tRNA (guanine37-N1)-methyltransferase
MIVEFHFLSLFPEVFSGALQASLLGKAQQRGLVSYSCTQIRDFSSDRHRTVDDTPFGGGEGMLLKPDVLYAAWVHAAFPELRKEHSGSHAPPISELPLLTQKDQPSGCRTLLLSPQGSLLTQERAKNWLKSYNRFVLVCGHYEGVDQRWMDRCVDEEVSIGNYVLTGGELPALVLADVVTRLIPGVVGNERSLSEDSLEGGLLKYPQFTRPREFLGVEVPTVLGSGNHVAIEKWRRQQALEQTRSKRPDLWAQWVKQAQQSAGSGSEDK